MTPSTLVVGIDVAKEKPVERVQDVRGLEFGMCLTFQIRIQGFELLLEWARCHVKENSKNQNMLGRTTGLFWLNWRLGR